MSIRVAIEHRTVYRYDRSVRLGPHVVRLRPAPHTRTPILAYSLRVSPASHFVNWQQDPYGNHLARLVFPEATTELSITVDLVADLIAINPFDFFVDESARTWPFRYPDGLARDLSPYLEAVDAGPLLDAWMAEYEPREMPVIDFLVAINQQVLNSVAYSVRMEEGVLAPDQTLERGIGSCRDSAWLLVAILRRLGIAARFASGYLIQLAQDRPATSDRGQNIDFTDLHAWAEAFIPGAGWVGLDATSGLLTGEGHIPLACTSSPDSAAPVEGTLDAVHTTFEHSNTVRRIDEPPRVTKPYTDGQWERIDALGRQVDTALLDGDVRLTMGGEPTFVSASEPGEPEWSTQAVGGHKEELATALTMKLADAFAPGALIQHGQGKWYPGEPLPRWQIGIHWRTDGVPFWRDHALLADPSQDGSATVEDAARLASAIADELGLPQETRYPVYEDPIPLFWRESRLPGGDPLPEPHPDPSDETLANADVRVELIAELDASRAEPLGWALPLHRDPGDEVWSTGLWHLRRGHVFLVEGDSPIGLRLPLASLTWTPAELHPDQSLFRHVDTLGTPTASEHPAAEILEEPPITALCVELRGGHLRIFLPPLKELAHFVELIDIVERTAATVGPVVVEGYPPPKDVRAAHFVVAPDPGVIEVNIHPSDSWPELVRRATTMDEAARELGLTTEKFALDGTHMSTGGGSHITLGGPTPADSPILRRPDLLRSLLTYWQHHPSLSYLFSGRFIGPTSQAPRIDEARHESLYELEIAFNELERLSQDGSAPSWLVDRALRHLLTDLTGNTHRAEFCIDKLFNPDSESGRLGVVELRGFEMAPHPQMALIQTLLVRALVARFWATPYSGRLVRWGTELHDRFLLPWWVEGDIREVIDDLGRHGFPFEPGWLAPFLEFRFPPIGTVTVDDVSLELRSAIEPWNVLAEDATAGNSRYVDSSLERLQVRVEGLTADRYAVTCNRQVVPLHATDTPGTFVAGVRYRAWQPPSSLHPMIGVHSPLTFDLVDRWSSRSLGGCRYHVTHPGGRSYERIPVNAAEAQARRVTRFEAIGHSPGTIDVGPVRRNGEYPRTLDLRRSRSGT